MLQTGKRLYEKLKHIDVGNPLCAYTEERCERLEPVIDAIVALKEEKQALILAHSYVHPDIIYGVADHTGDSYGLAKKAREADGKIIVFPAVRFMAETAKILNPDKLVIDPNPNGGCSLADSISAETVWKLRQQHPHHTFVCYINTTAAVKAACDVCVTSSNALEIIEAIPNDKIYFLPDKLMGENLRAHLKKKKIDKELLVYHGTCYVHEAFEAEQVAWMRQEYENLTVLAHPECRPEVAQQADYVASTTGILEIIKKETNPQKQFLILTECGIISRLQVESPKTRLVGGCMLCRYMKSNSLEAIRQALEDPHPSQIVEIDPSVQQGALNCLNHMFAYSR
jgi:quinolinate synthetase complex, A subunit